jgi:CHAT domain-containing protein
VRQGVETYPGLDAAFIAKGSKAVVSSLWPVNDLAAMFFMTSLHAGIAAGKDPTAFDIAACQRSALQTRIVGFRPLVWTTPLDPLISGTCAR